MSGPLPHPASTGAGLVDDGLDAGLDIGPEDRLDAGQDAGLVVEREGGLDALDRKPKRTSERPTA
eukprot:105129-Pleurochrysis_carterae.AAC.5